MADAGDPKTQAPATGATPGAAAPAPNRNIQILAGTLFLAIVAVLLVVVVLGPSGKKPAPVDASTRDAEAATTTLLAGIEQHGFTLGSPKALINLVEFLDVQCPFCAAHQLDQQPTVIRDVVRTGKATITMQPIPLLGEDSQAGRVVLARMAEQNKAWNFLNIWYYNQPQERTGYVKAPFLTKVVRAATGQTPDAAVVSTTPDATITKALAEIDTVAHALKVSSTPSFAIGRTGQPISTYKIYDVGQSSKAAGAQLVDAVNAAAAKAGAS